MSFTFPRFNATDPARRSRLLFGGIKLLALIVVAAGLTAAKCGGGGGCKACVCTETKQVRVELMHQGSSAGPIAAGSSMFLSIFNGNGTISHLNSAFLQFNGNSATATLTTPIPKSALVDENDQIRNPPDATFAAFDDRICSTEECAPFQHNRFILLHPPTVDYDLKNCILILRFNTVKICTPTCP